MNSRTCVGCSKCLKLGEDQQCILSYGLKGQVVTHVSCEDCKFTIPVDIECFWCHKPVKVQGAVDSGGCNYPFLKIASKALCCSNKCAAAYEKQIMDDPRIDSTPNCIVCGKEDKEMSKCAGCHRIYYCSRECQKSDWKRHKSVCN